MQYEESMILLLAISTYIRNISIICALISLVKTLFLKKDKNSEILSFFDREITL